MSTQHVRPEKEQGSRIKDQNNTAGKAKVQLENRKLGHTDPCCTEVPGCLLVLLPLLFLPLLLLLPPRCRCATALMWFFVVSPILDSDNIAPFDNTYPIA